MKLTNFKVLTFDCYGTLIDWETGIVQALHPWLTRHQMTLSDEEILDVFASYESQQQKITPQSLYPEILTNVHKSLAKHWHIPATAQDEQAFANSVKDWPAFLDAAKSLQYLKQHYKLAILSHVDKNSFAASNKKFGVEFDAIFTAEEMGSYKLDENSFRFMLNKLADNGFNKTDILHTAQLYHDRLPAAHLGLATCGINRRHNKISGARPDVNHNVQPNFTVNDLTALVQLHKANLEQELSSLDPKDWDEFEKLGNQMLKDMKTHLSTVRERPVWRPVPSSVKEQLQEALPLEPTAAPSVYNTFKNNILPYSTGNTHPRFWGWVMGTGTPYAMLADMLASGMNTHPSGFDDSSVLIEDQVIRWLSEILKLPTQSSGLLVNGCTMGNILAIMVARNAKAQHDIKKEGLQGIKAPLVLYCSTETHSWVQKAADLLGLGLNALRSIPVNQNFQLDVALLQSAITQDRLAGLHPFCVVGTVGTVNTGAIDELEKIAKICQKEDLWFHIDGAFGALAVLSEKYQHLIAGQNLADSIAFDLHKWMYMPFDVGCVLIKDHKAHEKTFTVSPSYLKPVSRGVAAKPLKYANLGLELTRSFRALKVWMSIKIHGVKSFSQLIEKNIEQAHYLADLINQRSELQLVVPPLLNILCFRYVAKQLKENELNDFNQELLLQIQESGIAVPSGTTIEGKFVLRVAITNHRSQKEDFDLFVESILKIGNALEKEFYHKKDKPTEELLAKNNVFTNSFSAYKLKLQEIESKPLVEGKSLKSRL